MEFIHPSFLWALTALSIPLIIHLFNFRRYKRVLFSNVSMLKKIETESRKTRQIKKWLVLLSRMLAIAALVFAFAQPYIPIAQTNGGRVLQAVYLDNSFSMNSRGEKGQLFEQAKNASRSLIEGLDQNAKVLMLSNDRIGSDKVLDKVRALEWIDDLDVSSSVNDLNAISKRLELVRDREGFEASQLYLISDHQRAKDAVLRSDSVTEYFAVDLSPVVQRNLAIDTVWLASPINKVDEVIGLNIKLSNYGEQDIESATITLKVNGAQQGAESFSIKANSSKDLLLSFTGSEPGWLEGELTVSDQTVQFDNQYFFSLNLKNSYRVALLSDEASIFKAVFEGDDQFDLLATSTLDFDYSSLNSFDMVVLDEVASLSTALADQLNTFVKDGGVVLYVPSSEGQPVLGGLQVSSYGALTPIGLSVRTEDLKHPFFSGVYARIPENSIMPKVNSVYSLMPDANAEVLLGLKNDYPVLVRRSLGRGFFYQYALPMKEQFTNIYEHELFVLVALKAAFSKNSTGDISYVLNNRAPIPLDVNAGEKALMLQGDDQEIIVQSSTNLGKFRFWLNDAVEGSGIYKMHFQDDEKTQALVALNYNRSESVQEYDSKESLSEAMGREVKWYSDQPEELQTLASNAASGKPLWKLFIIFSLIFLLIEILLLRFLKS